MKVRYTIDRFGSRVIIRIRIGKFTVTIEVPP